MPNAPKRKRLERVPGEPVQTNQKFICCRCGTAFSRQKGYFPVSHSPLYRGTGYLPFCNDCVEDMYEKYRRDLSDDREAMRRMCMKMDLYWSDDIYDMVERTAGVNSRIRNYIGKTNIVRYIDKSYDDTLRDDARAQKTEPFYIPNGDDGAQEPEQEPVDQSIIDFWGGGLQPDMYAELERRYADWTAGAANLDPGERSLYRQICLMEVTIARDLSQGKAIDKNVNALNNLLGSMNLKPAQKKEDVDAELERMPLGVGLQKWEEDRPLPPTPPALRDVHGIVKNILTWVNGHLGKMLGIKNANTELYDEAVERLRVKHPEYDDEDDDTLLNDIFGDKAKDVE